jgi:hypothetical protein
MGVYVDPLMRCIRTKRWQHDKACHLVADELGELHAFARRLGLHPEWFQTPERLPHYDLTEGKRAAAVRLGAVEIDRAAMGAMIEKWRARHAMEAATPKLFGDGDGQSAMGHGEEKALGTGHLALGKAEEIELPPVQMQRGLFGG